MRRERALLELETPPVDLQPILLAVQLLELDEELPAFVLRADDEDAEHGDGRGEGGHQREIAGRGAHAASLAAVSSATGGRATRACGWRAIWGSVGRTRRPPGFNRGRASSGMSGSPA